MIKGSFVFLRKSIVLVSYEKPETSLTIFSFSPYNLTFVNFFSFSILLFLIFIIKKKTQSKYRKKKSRKYFFYLGCAFGFGFFLFGNYWITISLTHDQEFKNLRTILLISILQKKQSIKCINKNV